jgi:hypothetical protein
MARRAPGELEQLLKRFFYSFPRSFRTKNLQFLSENDWADLDDLKA